MWLIIKLELILIKSLGFRILVTFEISSNNLIGVFDWLRMALRAYICWGLLWRGHKLWCDRIWRFIEWTWMTLNRVNRKSNSIQTGFLPIPRIVRPPLRLFMPLCILKRTLYNHLLILNLQIPFSHPRIRVHSPLTTSLYLVRQMLLIIMINNVTWESLPLFEVKVWMLMSVEEIEWAGGRIGEGVSEGVE